jgi:uncharacterized protein with HEPN domain
MLNNIPQVTETIWKFVHELTITNFSNKEISDQDASALYEIIKAAETIVKLKPEINELLNK